MAFLTSDLVTAVKRRAMIPSSQITFQAADFYALGDEELRSKLVPLVMKNMEEFWIVAKDYALTANQASYTIPTRAVAQGLRDVQIVQSSDDLSRTPLERLDPGDLYSSYSGNYRFTVRKSGFYLQGNNVVVYPTPTSTLNLLRLSYTCRPNQFVDTTACGQVQSIDRNANTVTLVTIPSTFTVSSPLDFINAAPGFDWAAQDQTPTLIVGTTLTFATTLPTSLVVGDWICLSGETCVMQVPVELQPLLYQYVVVRVLSAQGDEMALRDAIAELEKLEANAQLLIAPRVKGKPKRCVNSRAINRFV